MQNDWKREASFKRRAQCSTVILMETEDPKRIDELLEFVVSEEFASKNYFNMELKKAFRRVVADPWEGLTQWNGKEWLPVEAEGASPFGGVMGMDLATATRRLDEMLKREPTVAVIKNISSQELARAISLALQNWATQLHQ